MGGRSLTMTTERQLAINTHRRVLRAMRFPANTDSCSRHVRLMGETLMRGKKYHMFEEEPEHCAVSLLVTVESLWKARLEIERLKKRVRK